MRATAVAGEAGELYKRHWQHFIPIALVVYVIIGLIGLALGATLGVVGVILSGLVSIIGIFWLQGALVEAVRDVRDGRADLSIGETFRRVQPRLPSIIVAGLLAGIAIIIGFFLFIVPGLFLLTIWALIIPAIVLEGRSAMESFGRSRELVRGNGWSVFALILITIGIWIVASIVVSIALFWLPDSIQGFLQSVVTNTLVVPFVATAWTLVYYAVAGERTVSEAAEPVAPAY